MAIVKMVPSIALVISALLLFVVISSCEAKELKACKFDAIYQFGDSLSDTGNCIVEIPKAPFSHKPYGQTINNATGRASDGLLIIDYIAQSAGLPLLDPYKKKAGTNFAHGVNFALVGVTARSVEKIKKRMIDAPYNKAPLDVQLQWFDAVLNHTHRKGAGNCSVKKSLFMLGEIGGNDYNYELWKITPEKAKHAVVPDVIKLISDAVQHVIKRGATRVVVPGIFPLGCSPLYLQRYGHQKSKNKEIIADDEYGLQESKKKDTKPKKNNTTAHDKYGCLKAYNDLFKYHNKKLQEALEKLKKKYPATHIVYGDLYNAFQHVVDNSSKLGFREITKACCGGGGKYNYNPEAKCGDKNYTVCANPNEYISWDGIHLTQQTYKYMAEWLIRNIYPKLGCNVDKYV